MGIDLKAPDGTGSSAMDALLEIARHIAESSTASRAKGFDAAKWLNHWIELPQASLGGRKPSDLIDTAVGLEAVARLLASTESGAYQ